MYISHKSNVLQSVHELEWECRRIVKGINVDEYWPWLESVTTDDVPDYSGETGYTIMECTDEDVRDRLGQLDSYIDYSGIDIVYNIKYYVSKRDAEEILDDEGNSHDPKQYVQSHFVGDDSARDARILAEEWTIIRVERDRLLTSSDWTQGADSPLASGKKTEWATYRTKLRDVPKDQKDKTTYASITWPSEPS